MRFPRSDRQGIGAVEVDTGAGGKGVRFEDFQEMPDWTALSVRGDVTYETPGATNQKPGLVFTIDVARRYTYWTTNVIFPLSLFMLLLWFGFAIPRGAEGGARFAGSRQMRSSFFGRENKRATTATTAADRAALHHWRRANESPLRNECPTA